MNRPSPYESSLNEAVVAWEASDILFTRPSAAMDLMSGSLSGRAARYHIVQLGLLPDLRPSLGAELR